MRSPYTTEWSYFFEFFIFFYFNKYPSSTRLAHSEIKPFNNLEGISSAKIVENENKSTKLLSEKKSFTMLNDSYANTIPCPDPDPIVVERSPRKKTVSPSPPSSSSPSSRKSSRHCRSQRNRSPCHLNILIAPSGFKEALGPEDAAQAIETGLRRAIPDDTTVTMTKLPLHDGGEGFCRALVAQRGGKIMTQTVMGPVGDPVDAHWGVICEEANDGGDNNGNGHGNQQETRTAVLDMAAAAGLRLVPDAQRDPARTTTFGVGELMRAALDADPAITRLVIGCGDSGTSDGGAGMLQALGAQLLDADGHELPRAGGAATLARLDRISLATLHPRLQTTAAAGLGVGNNDNDKVTIQAVCNIENVLGGPRGVARVYGPQKGATTEAQIEVLAHGLDRLAAAMRPLLLTGPHSNPHPQQQQDEDIATVPGSGASGGLGAGLLLLGAELRPRSDAIDEYFHLDRVLGDDATTPWDFIFTAEGSLDAQSAHGKMTVDVARRGAAQGAQVVALAGTIGRGADAVYGEGIEAFTSILRAPMSLEEALRETETLLKDEAERTMRMILVGMAARSRHTIEEDHRHVVDERMRNGSPSRPEMLPVLARENQLFDA